MMHVMFGAVCDTCDICGVSNVYAVNDACDVSAVCVL